MTTEKSLKPDDDNHHARGGHIGASSLAVNAYLEYVAEQEGDRRGPKPKSSDQLDEMIKAEPNLARKLVLIQQQLDALERENKASVGPRLEEKFIRHARTFGDHYGISYGAWRMMGVSASVLRQAGIEPAAVEEARPSRKGTRRKMTPEFAAEIMAVWEAAGGEERVVKPSGALGYMKGNLAVAETFNYGQGYVPGLMTDARACLAGEPTRKQLDRDKAKARRELESAPPEALAANTG